MRRTIRTGLQIWSRKGAAWPFQLLVRTGMNMVLGLPRGLMVEPSSGCTGNCSGCRPPVTPFTLHPDLLDGWLRCRPAKPVTVHFSGRHSDPLASPLLTALAETARAHCSMLSLSTIGLGFQKGMEYLPVDRWIVSIPAATRSSWIALRGHDRLDHAIETVSAVTGSGNSMVELVLTIWRQSESDEEAFRALAARTGATAQKTVFGRYDPEGYHTGRAENLAVNHPDSRYLLDSTGKPELKQPPSGCPLAGSLFLDAEGVLRPCPFTGNEAPFEPKPAREAWSVSKRWTVLKKQRRFPACRFCI